MDLLLTGITVIKTMPIFAPAYIQNAVTDNTILSLSLGDMMVYRNKPPLNNMIRRASINIYCLFIVRPKIVTNKATNKATNIPIDTFNTEYPPFFICKVKLSFPFSCKTKKADHSPRY